MKKENIIVLKPKHSEKLSLTEEIKNNYPEESEEKVIDLLTIAKVIDKEGNTFYRVICNVEEDIYSMVGLMEEQKLEMLGDREE